MAGHGLERGSRLQLTCALLLIAAGLPSCRDLGSPLDSGVPVPTSIVILAPVPPYRLLVGSSLHFRAEVRDQMGFPIAGSAIGWISSTPTVASIDASGLMQALGVGQTQIHATSGALTSPPLTAEVLATAGPVDRIVIVSPTDPSVVVGGTVQFVAEARDAQGIVIQVPLAWVSGTPAVATIDATGLAQGLLAGTTEIRAEADSVESNRVVLTVLTQALDFDTEIQPIFTGRCALSGCHAGVTPQRGLDLSAGAAYDEIVGVPSTSLAEWLRVSPGNPAASLLYRKVSEDAPPVGARMPLGGTLSDPEIQRIHDWIAGGAPR